MSTLTPFVLSADSSTITTRSDSHRTHSFQVDLVEKSPTNRKEEMTQESNDSKQITSIAN